MTVWRDERINKWRYAFQHQGKRYSGSAETKHSARAKEAEHLKEVKKPNTRNGTSTDYLFSKVANDYLAYSERRHAKKTFEYKRMVFKNFIRSSGDRDIRTIQPIDLHAYLNSRPSNHNYNAHRKELCSLFSFAIKHIGLLDRSPCWNLDKLPEEQARKQIPTQEEFMRILAAAGPDERPLLIILAHTLARVDEILRLTWADVNFERQTVTLWTRKKKDGMMTPRHVPMNRDISSVLLSLWKRRKQDHWVFWNQNLNNPGVEAGRFIRRPKLMKSLCRRAGVQHYGFHSIRHFVATYLHDIKKVPTGVVGTILGHSSKRTTEIYLHSVDEAARMAMAQLDGFLGNLHTGGTHLDF